MATPEGASDMSLYEQHQKLKAQLDSVMEEWDAAPASWKNQGNNNIIFYISMKVFHFLPIAAFCLMTGACSTGKKQAELTAGIQFANLDTTALPGTDFYQYACGGWMKNNPIPAEYSQYGSFTILAENNRKQIQGLIEELAATQHEAGSVAQKIGDLYKIVMDSVKLNKDGVAPIKAELDQLAALKDKKELYALLGDMQKKGIIAYNVLYVALTK